VQIYFLLNLVALILHLQLHYIKLQIENLLVLFRFYFKLLCICTILTLYSRTDYS